ncbi:3'-5' exonuclease [Gemmatimonas sp.]
MSGKLTNSALTQDPEAMAAALEATGDYRVLRRFKGKTQYTEAVPGVSLRRGLIVDVETTGLDTSNDRIIELGLVAFAFDGAGIVYNVDAKREWFEDPGIPIPAEATEITGITNEMVRGQRIDEAAVLSEIERAHLVIAHNAGFDRRMLERRFPAFAAKHWGCSLNDVPWVRFGSRGAKLDYLLFQLCGAFHTGHRAGDDCQATLHVLAMPRDGDATPLTRLLERARRATVRISAIGTPIETKDLLKARGYRWFSGSPSRAKTWYRDVDEADVDAEQAWLRENAYGGLTNPPWRLEKFTAKERYSERMG